MADRARPTTHGPYHIETLKSPSEYSVDQIDFALRLALMLDRGVLVVCEEPRGQA